MKHQDDYRRYWMKYLDCTSSVRRKELESLMDQAQNHFSWNEFQEFKVTLPHYIDHWKGLLIEAKEKLDGLSL